MKNAYLELQYTLARLNQKYLTRFGEPIIVKPLRDNYQFL